MVCKTQTSNAVNGLYTTNPRSALHENDKHERIITAIGFAKCMVGAVVTVCWRIKCQCLILSVSAPHELLKLLGKQASKQTC